MADQRPGSAPPSPAPSDNDKPEEPALRPVFLWAVRKEDQALEVHCEDYDERNRLRITRTPFGWRCVPRTRIYDSVGLPKAPAPPARRRARGRPRSTHIDPPPPAQPLSPAPPEADVAPPPPPDSPSDAGREDHTSEDWALPDIEADIPSHTIHVPPRSPKHQQDQQQPDFNPTPLDNLLAVAEIEFNQQRECDDSEQRRLVKFPFLDVECDRDIMPSFDTPDSAKSVRSDDLFFADKQGCAESKLLVDEAGFRTKDLFESISDGHYMPVDLDTHGDHEEINDNDLLDSLVEKGCEDHDVTGSTFEKLAHLVNNNNNIEGDYNDEDEDMLMDNAPVTDIIHRLEQSLESPGQNSISAAHGLLNLQRMSTELEEAPEAAFAEEDEYDGSADNAIESPEEEAKEEDKAEDVTVALADNSEIYIDTSVPDDENNVENVDNSNSIEKATVDDEQAEIENFPVEEEEQHEEDVGLGEEREEIEEAEEERELEEETELEEDRELEEERELEEARELEEEREAEEVDREEEGEIESQNSGDNEQEAIAECQLNTIIETIDKSDSTVIEKENEELGKDESASDKENELPESVEELPTDLSIKQTSEDIRDELSDKSDEMPKDLSCRKRQASPFPSPKRVETPRPASRGSDTIQSPQPSGIPAVPSSPELFPVPHCKNGSKSLFLETLLASPSPKMCFSSELTITKHQSEPLNLGKNRKSASPTVSSCSEEVKKPSKEFGEPEEKRFRKESTDEAPLQKLNKLFSKTGDSQHEIKQKRSDSRNQRSAEEPSPLKQLQLLRSSTEFKIPDPMLVPKEKFSAILLSPAKEIPALLLQRPELRLPEAFAFPAVLQDPDILVVSLSQLEAILQKHSQNADKEVAKMKDSKHKPSTPSAISDIGKVSSLTSPSVLENLSKATIGSTVPNLGSESLAGDIDAATSAALNQMLWLPYLSQFEAAMACTQNADFLKALNTSVPPGYPSQPPYPDLSQIFSPQSRFMGSPGFPVMPSLDYGNQLEIAMWQEAMAQANNANFQRALKTNMTPESHMKDLHKNSEANAYNKHQMRGHTAARTSPIAHGYPHCNRSGVPYHPGWTGYPGRTPHQASQFSPSGTRPGRHQPSPSSSASPSNFYQNNNYLNGPKPPSGLRTPTTPTGQHSQSHSSDPKPRISVKSLQNLLEPGPGAGPSPGLGLMHHRPLDPEVGSSTHVPEEVGHDGQAPLWHPLFGNQKNYSSPWNWTTVTVNGD